LRLGGRAKEIHRRIKEEISKRFRLKESLKYLENFNPTKDREEIIRRQEYLKEGFRKLRPELSELLSSVRKPEFKRKFFRDRLLVVDRDELQKAEELGICEVSTEIEDGYTLILSTGSSGFTVGLSPEEITPEIYVEELWKNRGTLEALAKIGEITQEGSVAEEILKNLEAFEEIKKREEVLENLHVILREEEKELNRRIESRVKDFTLNLSGEELLSFLRDLRRGDHDALLSRFSELGGFILEEIRRSEERISGIIGSDVEIFSRESLYPVEIPRESEERIIAEIERELRIEKYFRSLEILRKIRNLIAKIDREIERAHEIEFLRAVKEFSEGFIFPEIGTGGLWFEEGRHLFIDNPQPVSYVIGEIMRVPETEGERIIILTGANSGGKTSLLELITQIEILSHMGFPVNARRAVFEPLDEIFFFSKGRVSYGAGAFESALRRFVSSLSREGKRLILVDEFEAITEPGAAIKILAEILKIADEKGFYVVIVSHLGERLKEEIPEARVDGIEARGLDENLRLIVDRQPKFGKIGRSTPELIVERLYRSKRGEEKEIFERILKKFR